MHTTALIIGAGPFGLSLAACADRLGIERTMLGEPMGFWRDGMPAGMILRSDCDWHLDPMDELTIRAFLDERGQRPEDVEPLPLAIYLEYAEWFRRGRDLAARPGLVTALERGPSNGMYSATLDTGEELTADAVVIAGGFGCFEHVPEELAAILPADRTAHTSDAVDLEAYAGDRVAIVGGRQSAFEWAALLAEAGARSVDVVHRHDTPRFEESDWSWVPAIVDATVDDPGWFRNLSPGDQKAIEDRLWDEGRGKLEPWLAERVGRGGVTLRPNVEVVSCDERDGNDGAGMLLELSDGARLEADRVIFATGYRPDIRRIPYLSAELLDAIDHGDGLPVLNESFETSSPGLFFTSMAAVGGFGPFMAFTVSVRASAWIIANALAGGRPGGEDGEGRPVSR